MSAMNASSENRKLFLHKGAWFKFKGYSFSMLHKAKQKHSDIKKLHNFEKKYNISHTTTIGEIEKEIELRKLV